MKRLRILDLRHERGVALELAHITRRSETVGHAGRQDHAIPR